LIEVSVDVCRPQSAPLLTTVAGFPQTEKAEARAMRPRL
jgi:hypothetical protein